MATVCMFRPTNPGAITVSQFLEALQRTWRESRRTVAEQRALPHKLGLAVSGGADSMALAYLCKQWEIYRDKLGPKDDVSVTAFVVDHKAREESSQEANIVAQWLNEMCIKTQILELEWPEGSLSNMSAFETHARRLRFQALGKACRDHQIEALLMGHHQDDNVETMLWRLCSGARGAGLAGIPPVAHIPECHGIYGVSQSGSTVFLHPEELLGSSPMSQELKKNRRLAEYHKSPPIPTSTGGILVFRPLLSFPKASLLATCHENKIPFVSDPTNFDPTLTPRNAIRSLLASSSLPRALQPPSILALVEKSHNLIQDSINLSNELLSECKIFDLTLTTGTIKVQFPSSVSATEPSNPSSILNRTHQVQCLTLRRITELISPFPENHFSLHSFQNFTHRVFSSSPESVTTATTNTTTKQTPFTVGGVMFHPRHPTTNPSAKTNNTWFLARQPFMRYRLPVLQFDAPIQNRLHQDKGNGDSTERGGGDEHDLLFTPWKLWDHRYWFRFAIVPVQHNEEPRQHYSKDDSSKSALIFNMGSTNQVPLVVRPLQQPDLHMIRQKPSRHTFLVDNPAAILKRLEREAPGQSRFTIPLLCIDKGPLGLERDLPLALPTMDSWLLETTKLPKIHGASRPWTVRWEWKYKMIEEQALKSMVKL